MPFQPGHNPTRKPGRKPRIGEQVTVYLREDQLAMIDGLRHRARRAYLRLPRVFRSRAAVVRAAIDGDLADLEARVAAAERRKEARDNAA